MIPSPNLLLYRYNVDVLPTAERQPAPAGKKLNQIIRLLLELPEYREFRNDIVTDFKSTLVSRRRLSPDTGGTAIQYRAEREDEPRDNAQIYRIRVQETGTLTVSELTDYLTSTNVNTAYDKLPVSQALNIFLGHYTKTSPTISTVGSSKSFSLAQNSPSQNLGAGLTALRGFFSSVRVATCRILVNVNVSHGAFYDAIPLDQLINRYYSAHGINRVKLQGFLKRVRVRVIHLGEKKNKAGESIPRVKTIFGLANPNDGYDRNHLVRPPRVPSFGAGPKEVEFFVNDSSEAPSSSSTSQAPVTQGSKKKGKGKKGSKSSQGPSQDTLQSGESSQGPGQDVQDGRYISVYDHFRTGMYSITARP